MQVDPEKGRTALPRAVTEPWVQVALSARVMQQTLRLIPATRSGAPLDIVRRFLPEQPVDVWCRGFLEAALEHLVMWADYATPLKYHPEASVEFALRPAQTLARAAVESSAQAVWILATTDYRVATQRHAALVLADWDEQRKASLDEKTKAELKTRSDALQRSTGFTDAEVRAPSYLSLVRHAAAHVREQLPAALLGSDDAVERLWRASAGSAHGKQWPASELTVVVPKTGGHHAGPGGNYRDAEACRRGRHLRGHAFRRQLRICRGALRHPAGRARPRLRQDSAPARSA